MRHEGHTGDTEVLQQLGDELDPCCDSLLDGNVGGLADAEAGHMLTPYAANGFRPGPAYRSTIMTRTPTFSAMMPTYAPIRRVASRPGMKSSTGGLS